MNPIAFDADATFIERHATTLFVVLLVATAAAALTSLDRSLLAHVATVLASGAAR
jgi:hypothetical protein